MNILEKDVETVIYNSYRSDGGAMLRERGLHVCKGGQILRQVNISGVGTADLVVVSEHGASNSYPSIVITVIELKRGEVGYREIAQLARYTQSLQEVRDRLDEGYSLIIDGILIGRNLTAETDLHHLIDIMHDHNIETYLYSLNMQTGIHFDLKYGFAKDIGSFKEGAPKIHAAMNRTNTIRNIAKTARRIG